MKALPHVDVVIVGAGWTGLLTAKELGSRTSPSIVVLERGAAHSPTEYANRMDGLEHSIHFRMMQELSRETVTIRPSTNDRAYPVPQYGSFLRRPGVGGSCGHSSWGCP